jgi:TolB-like protein
MQLIVRPLATVSRFAHHDPIQSGRDLGVEAVVEGSVQTADNRIRVSVRLLRVHDAKPLWAQTFQRLPELTPSAWATRLL